jgi:rhodanese-related sulfurtransferase
MVPSPETLVVVNCAGRTRSIIGAQSLINAGLPNPVLALKDGTMGWHLAGLDLERGQTRVAPPPTVGGLARAQAAAERVTRRFSIRRITHSELDGLRQDAGRSLYLLDVRAPEEYAAGHLPASLSAPGGQLVQATDLFIGTLNARLVLVDGDGVRATMTASWLVQMGWSEVFVLTDAFIGIPLVAGAAAPEILGLDVAVSVPAIEPVVLRDLLRLGEATVVDLDSSLRYREGHIPGAWFAIRSRLARSLPGLPLRQALVLTSRDGVLARLAVADAMKSTDVPVRYLAGGTAAWAAAGLPLAEGLEHMADATDDAWYRPYDRTDGVEAAMKEYLNWEVELVRQIERDGDVRFRRFPV